MRSLTLKLTLAFLLVGALGVGLFTALVGQRTRSDFTRFLSERDELVLVDTLHEHFETVGSWAGVDARLQSNGSLAYYGRELALLNADGQVVFGNRTFHVGDKVSPNQLRYGVPVRVADAVVGVMLFGTGGGDRSGPDRGSVERTFFDNVLRSAAISALVTVIAALLVGVVLARTLTRPVKALIAATRVMGTGDLSQRVDVHSRDEIGQLAASFNQMSADLARASQSRKQMTADLAHDLRTPLSILRGYTEGLKEERLAGAPAIYAVMHDEVEHLQRLVEDLRVLSLADAGELVLTRRSVDPRALLERTALSYMMQAEEHGLALRVEAAEGLPSVNVDTDRLAQVLKNLVANALRHTQEGEIVLSAVAEGGRVRLCVGDTGSGISAEDLPLVFERLYRGDAARQRTAENSSGLGLAIAKAIVEAHGGAIAVASTAGHGTVFTIDLPAV